MAYRRVMIFEFTEDLERRAAAALNPFVRAFNLPVNPEELGLMAYAVLRYTYSDEPLAEVAAAVRELIDQHIADHQRMLRAMESRYRATGPEAVGALD